MTLNTTGQHPFDPKHLTSMAEDYRKLDEVQKSMAIHLALLLHKGDIDADDDWYQVLLQYNKPAPAGYMMARQLQYDHYELVVELSKGISHLMHVALEAL